MKRRDFLKILGVAVITPGAMIAAVKTKPKQHVYKLNFPDDVQFKCYGKHGQNCVCNSCVEDMIVDCLPSLRSGNYYAEFKPFPIEADRKRYRKIRKLPA